MGKKNKKRVLKRRNAFLKRENELLRQAALQAQSTAETKSTYLSHMSHDIRTSINGIVGMTGIAIKNYDDRGKMLDCLKKVDTSSRYLMSLVNDILDISRIESGKMSVNHERMDMRNIIDSCALIAEGLLAQRRVNLVREFEAFRHPLLLGDELHLSQILVNILGNAVKFTPDGGKIYFQVKEVAGEEGRAVYRFEIEDTGIGMEEAFLDRIWEPFLQETCRSCSGQKGTGLGMTITKKLVDLMEGTIKVESRLGVGSRFTVEIAFDIEQSGCEKEKIQESDVNLNGMKILLVEDNELNMEIAKTMLEEEGIEVTTAENGQSAVNIFHNCPEGRFDAILMDIRMPVMDGISAAKTIRKLPERDAAAIPIIAMTADAYEEDIRRTIDAGMNAHLTKPVQPEKLFQTLRKYSDKNKQQAI